MSFLKKNHFLVIFIKKNPILSAIVFIGFLLRIVGTNPGYYMHGYEVIYGDSISMILNKTIGLSYTNLAYPPLVFWIMALGFAFIFIPLSWAGYIIGHFPQVLEADFWTQVDNIFNNQILGTRYWQNAMYWGRYITALFGTGAIILIYKVVREYFGSKAMALIAAFMLAVNYRLVINSHMGFFDIYNVFFILLVLFAVGRLIKQPSKKTYIIAAVCVALSFLIKYQPSGLLVFGIAHLLICIRQAKGNKTRFVKSLFSKSAILSVVALSLILFVAHINYFLRLNEVLAYSTYVWSANEFHKYRFYFFPFSYVYQIGLGPALTLISIVGIAIGLINNKYRESTLILSAPIFLSFYLFGFFSTGGYYTYNLLLPISLMLIFSALSLREVYEWFLKKYKKKIPEFIILVVFAVVLTLALKDQVYNSFLSTYILAQPSYRIVAEEWLMKNIEGPAVFATHSSNPRLQKDNIKIVDLPALPEVYGFREFVEEKYDYTLIDFFKIQEKNFWWMLSPPRIPTQFWEKPDDLLSQNYLALATRELLWNHTIKDFMLPWQASGYNYALTKVKPPTEFSNERLLNKFDFEDSKNIWSPLVFLEKDKDKLVWQEEGKEEKGALVIKKGKEAGNNKWLTIPGGVRWESSELIIKPGYGYKVTGWIKNNGQIDKKYRNGFLRLDFYKSNKEISITSRPIITFVSARPYGESNWHKVEVQGIAPLGANFIRIGFQADDSTLSIYLDDVELYETSEEVREENLQRFEIRDDDFFRPSDSSFT